MSAKTLTRGSSRKAFQSSDSSVSTRVGADDDVVTELARPRYGVSLKLARIHVPAFGLYVSLIVVSENVDAAVTRQKD